MDFIEIHSNLSFSNSNLVSFDREEKIISSESSAIGFFVFSICLSQKSKLIHIFSDELRYTHQFWSIEKTGNDFHFTTRDSVSGSAQLGSGIAFTQGTIIQA
jgi:hypothetical protein